MKLYDLCCMVYHADYRIGVFSIKYCNICAYFVYFKSREELNYEKFVDPIILGAPRLVHSDLRIYRISFFLLYRIFKSRREKTRAPEWQSQRLPTTRGHQPWSYFETLSSLKLPFSSSSTTSRELLSQFSTCSGWRWLQVGGKRKRYVTINKTVTAKF